jgi:hypothetical protein
VVLAGGVVEAAPPEEFAVAAQTCGDGAGELMPWHTQADVAKHNKSAGKSKRKGKVWRKVANKLLASGASEGSAIRQANAAAGRMYGGKDRK